MEITEYKCGTLWIFVQTSLSRFPSDVWIFRGQSNIDWPLVPKAGRPNFFLPLTENTTGPGIPPRDLGRFNAWRSDAVAYCQSLPENDFECLAFAQHYGLATRLLDWSTNPLVALYFVVEAQPSCDGAVYCYLPWIHVDHKNSPLDGVAEVARYDPRPFVRRILAQAGVFTYHPTPTETLSPGPALNETIPFADNGRNLSRFRVTPAEKSLLQRQLDRIGISRKSLFPDLEGLSSFTNWETERWAAIGKPKAQAK